MDKWFVGYFYHGYLKQLISAFDRNKSEFGCPVEMWYPQITQIRVKNGQKIEKKVPVFDNYVLFKFEESSLVWMKIVKMTPIIKFLSDSSNNLPVPLIEKEITHLLNIVNTPQIIDYTYLIGQRVIIRDGPFKGLIGTCEKIIKGRYQARVTIELFGVAEKDAEINLELLEQI